MKDAMAKVLAYTMLAIMGVGSIVILLSVCWAAVWVAFQIVTLFK